MEDNKSYAANLAKDVLANNEKKNVLMAGIMMAITQLQMEHPSYDVQEKLVPGIALLLKDVIGDQAYSELILRGSQIARSLHTQMQAHRDLSDLVDTQIN